MSFQTVSLLVRILLAVVAGFVALIFIAFPVLAIVSVRQMIDRRRRNWRDRWARQRVLQQAVAGIAASERTALAPAIEDYPPPDPADGWPDAG
jgi:hypothetical protein